MFSGLSVKPDAIVIGAGAGGLGAAIALASAGREVLVLERAEAVGGKLHEQVVGGARIDSGPTVLTMRWVFDELFEAAGTTLDAELGLDRADILARHAWGPDERLDLHADPAASADAIGRFSGAAEARRFEAFLARAREVYQTLEHSFLRSAHPSIATLVRHAGLTGLARLARITPHRSLWRVLGGHFHDPRLRQLFGRYATYCGASPFQAPATLMLVAHVEQEGVWLVRGGMQALAAALERVAVRRGVTIRKEAEVAEILVRDARVRGVRLASGEEIAAQAVVANTDVAALADGRFGTAAKSGLAPVARADRSLSAITFACLAETDGFPLVRHNVFFSDDYAAEFAALRRGRVPAAPTVYVCAQDRDDSADSPGGAERLLCLINAPPEGDVRDYNAEEIEQCRRLTLQRMEACGLTIRAHATVTTTPREFAARFPSTGGALYGRASHGWRASFRRAGTTTPTAGLYLAGGSVHPGPGVPMAALSGRLAAASLEADPASIGRSHRAATRGGMSTA